MIDSNMVYAEISPNSHNKNAKVSQIVKVVKKNLIIHQSKYRMLCFHKKITLKILNRSKLSIKNCKNKGCHIRDLTRGQLEN